MGNTCTLAGELHPGTRQVAVGRVIGPGSCPDSSRQEYWSGLPFLPPVDFPDPGIKPMFPVANSYRAF